jgi:hypothetical protein
VPVGACLERLLKRCSERGKELAMIKLRDCFILASMVFVVVFAVFGLAWCQAS